jgi:nitroreductase
METMKTIFTRQSVRSYQKKQITQQQLETLLKAAVASPIAMGRFNEMHLTVIQNADKLNEITLQARKVSGPDADPLYGAPTVILVSCKSGRSTIAANAACVVENMALAATDMGLGSVYLWGFIEGMLQNSELVKSLKLPEGFVPASAIAVGYCDLRLTEREISLDKISTNYIV